MTSADAPAPWLDRFVRQRRLDESAEGDVWLARDLRHDSAEVVLKRRRRPADARQRRLWQQRFDLECRIPTELAHPNVLPILDHGVTARAGWQVTRWLPEGDFGGWLRREAATRRDAVLRLLALAADALAHAHARGVVHRDLKPTNLLIDRGPARLQVADFGVAQVQGHALTATNVLIGTPAYMAPELLAGAPASAAADAYALGIIAYEALGGRRPHEGANLGALLMAVAREPIAPLRTLAPQLTPAAADLVVSLLDRAPERRPTLDAWAAQVRRLPAGPSG